MYRSFAEGKVADVLACYDKDVEWVRPGNPEIPFAGTYSGHEGMKKMLGVISETVNMREFKPEKFFQDENTVVVFGKDVAIVKLTGKKYYTNWVHSFTFKDKKITHVQVLIDTLAIAKAFQP
jgi:ketosteroid isomerase-like protein